jgi:hypothetical protein
MLVGPWTNDADPALIAAAPEMAALLNECAEALEQYEGTSSPLADTFARLADFDRRIG